MTEWTVTVDWRANDPLTDDQLFDVAAIGGAASGRTGDHDIATILTVDASDIPGAAAAALEQLLDLVPGDPVSVEVTTTAEADRRLDEPAFPELVGISEIADLLGVTRQRASALQTSSGFPAPVAVLRSGPVWRRGDLATFTDAWTRRPGRPSKGRVASTRP
jgi:hypothetical protein